MARLGRSRRLQAESHCSPSISPRFPITPLLPPGTSRVAPFNGSRRHAPGLCKQQRPDAATRLGAPCIPGWPLGDLIRRVGALCLLRDGDAHPLRTSAWDLVTNGAGGTALAGSV